MPDALTSAKDASLRDFMVEKEAEINDNLAQLNVGMQQTIASGCDGCQRLHQVLDQCVTGADTGASAGGGKGVSGSTSLLDSRDYKFPTMPMTCSVEQSKKWRHDGLAFLEANVSWSQASRVLHEIRKPASEVDVQICQ